MGPSLRDHASFVRPSTRDRPTTRGEGENSLVVPSRTSSLHSRITQPIASSLNLKPAQRTPKTLTHAYMVCGVGREPSQWVKAPPPAQGKIGHMKGAVGQFWLPEILGSSPRLEQDNEIARALHSAMRVGVHQDIAILPRLTLIPRCRPVSLMMSRFAPARASLTAPTTLLSSSRTPRTLCTVSRCASGPVPTRSVPRPFANCARRPSPTSTTTLMRPTGSPTA